jgi:hypothetical protein
MKHNTLLTFTASRGVAILCLGAAWIAGQPGDRCSAQQQSNTQPPPANQPAAVVGLPPGVSDVLKLARAGMKEDVILAKLKKDGVSYNLTTDQIIYLSNAGMSQNIIAALMQSRADNGSSAPVSAQAPTAAQQMPAMVEPPPLDAASPGSATAPSAAGAAAAPVATAVAPAPPPPAAPYYATAPAAPSFAVPASVPPPPMQAAPGFQDNFFTDAGLNTALWTVQSSLVPTLASVNYAAGTVPLLIFGPSGLQMSGANGPRRLTGIQSTASYMAPFTLTATVLAQQDVGIPFELYLVTSDLRQWLSLAGHLGGRGHTGPVLGIGGGGRGIFGGVRIPLGSAPSPEHGVWVNYTGSGIISALGTKIFEYPEPGVMYTMHMTVGADGFASVALVDSAGFSRGALGGLSVGTGPFYVVLANRDGPAYANWQSVQLLPATPVVAAPPAAPVTLGQPAVPATPTLDYFQSQLTPYGAWIDLPGYGLCWQPAVYAGWRPYYDGGHWEYTDAGWYWQSDYPWGDIAFHYGRWAYTGSGWVWTPGYEYAPAWVFWRHADADGFIGWAPLPPGALFVDGGWRYRGARVGFDFDFGLGAGFFTFVAYDHFWAHDFRPFIVPHDRLALVFGRSVIESHYRLDHGRFVNEGLKREIMAERTHHEIREVRAVHEVRRQEEQRNVLARKEDIRGFTPGKKQDAIRRVDPAGNQPTPREEEKKQSAKSSAGGERDSTRGKP